MSEKNNIKIWFGNGSIGRYSANYSPPIQIQSHVVQKQIDDNDFEAILGYTIDMLHSQNPDKKEVIVYVHANCHRSVDNLGRIVYDQVQFGYIKPLPLEHLEEIRKRFREYSEKEEVKVCFEGLEDAISEMTPDEILKQKQEERK